MNTSDEEAIKITIRLRCIEGHIRSVAEMVGDDVCPMDIVDQIEAIQASLKKINILLLDRHLHTCLITTIRDHNLVEREIMFGQIAGLFAARSKYHH